MIEIHAPTSLFMFLRTKTKGQEVTACRSEMMGLTIQLFLRFTRTCVISVSFSSLSTIVRNWKSLIYLDNLVLSTELIMLIMLGGGGGGKGVFVSNTQNWQGVPEKIWSLIQWKHPTESLCLHNHCWQVNLCDTSSNRSNCETSKQKKYMKFLDQQSS